MSLAAATRHATLRAYVDAYLGELTRFSYAELRQLQAPPHASVAYGAGGIAYALCRAGEEREDPRLLSRGWRWTSWAMEGTRLPGSLDVPGAPVTDRQAIYYGRLGLVAVRARLARARRRAGDLRVELARWRRPRAELRLLDLVGGIAGQLAGAAWLLRRGAHAPLARAAANAARTLETRLSSWTPRATDVSLAHGWPGVVFALLRWYAASGAAPSAELVARCRELARLRPAYGLEGAPGAPRSLPRSWCNGSAGMTLLWVALAEATGDALFVNAAAGAARATLAGEPDGVPTLCCGAGGRAYAYLAMERVQPRRWRRHAVEAALAAVADSRNTRWPNGLLRGHPGLVCLALDLESERGGGGYPLLED